MKTYTIGVDLGGTNIKAGLVDEAHHIVDSVSCKTNLPRPEHEVEAEIAALCSQLAQQIESVGIGTPGSVNPHTGVVEFNANFGYHNWPLVSAMEKLLPCRVYIENDANAAAYGEYIAGAAQGAKYAIAVTLGTGIGGGIIIDSKIIAGYHGAGGEIGHACVNHNEVRPCNCGNHGCLEQYASATGIVRVANDILEESQEDSKMRHVEKLSAKNVLDFYKEGDALAVKTMEKVGDILGSTLAVFACVTDPEAIVIGGGVSKAGKPLTDCIQKYYQKYAFPSCKSTPIILASLGNDAGIYGAARMVIKD
mgnify:CR=1 FL=1